jgi:drug/metabolite transporter (DMT)-like permease
LELWIPITVGAAFLQNLRSAAQKHLKSVMGTSGATFVRFGFGLPFAAFFVAILVGGFGQSLPTANGTFVAWCVLGAAAQIAATMLLIHLFSFRNFAVGTAYSRTEPAQAAVFGLVFLGDAVSSGTMLAILVSIIGVMLISVARTTLSPASLLTSLGSRNAIVGIASGTAFGISAVAYRAASLALGGPTVFMQAAFTLLVVITIQTASMLAWLAWRDRQELVRIGRAWRVSLFVGFVGATASFGWFTAMTLQQAAVVKALAQVEMVFTFASSVLFFRESINRMEVAGCVLIVGGILLLLLIG